MAKRRVWLPLALFNGVASASSPKPFKTRLHRARQLLHDQLDKQIAPVLMNAFPIAGRRCQRVTAAVMTRLGIAE